MATETEIPQAIYTDEIPERIGTDPTRRESDEIPDIIFTGLPVHSRAREFPGSSQNNTFIIHFIIICI